MMKRIMSLALALLMLMSVFPATVFASDEPEVIVTPSSDETAVPTGESEDAIPTGEPAPTLCEICNADPCVCEDEGGEKEPAPTLCETCGADPCVCEDEGGEKEPAPTLCEICNADPCVCEDEGGEDEPAPTLCEICNADPCVCDTAPAPDYSGDVGRYVSLNSAIVEYSVEDGAGNIQTYYSKDFTADTILHIKAWKVNDSGLWYQAEFYRGSVVESEDTLNFPIAPWFMQNNGEGVNALVFLTLCAECGKPDCGGHADPTATLCETCGEDPCICEEEGGEEESGSLIEIPACPDQPTCWGTFNGLPLNNHQDGSCTRKEFVKNYLLENTAETIATVWNSFTAEEQTDIMAMVEAYTTYADDLKALVGWGVTEPENPCGCCDECTGDEECACECEACEFCEKAEEPEYPVLTDDATGVKVTLENLPEGVSLSVSEADVSAQLNKYGVPAAKKVFGLDISLSDAENGDYQPEGALVKIPVSAAPGKKIGIIHTHKGVTSFMGLTTVQSDGTVEFYTNGFSEFAGFTVDFHYNGVDFSIDGRTSILLSVLFAEMGINENAYAAETVVFSDTSLVLPTRQDNGDWLLTSLEAFSTEETLIISFTDGHTIVIDVTDASKGVQTTNDQVHLSTSGTSKTYQIFGKLYPDVNGDYTSFATTVFGVEVDFVLYEGNAYPGTGNGSKVGTAWIDQAFGGVQFSLTGSYWYEVYGTNRCQVSQKGTNNFVFDSTSLLTGREVYIRRYPRTTYYNDNYCKVTQASVMSDSKTTRTVYIYTNGNKTPIGSWTGYFPDRTSAAASDLSVVPYKEWRLSKVEVSDGNYHVYLYSVHTITWQNSDKDKTVLEIDENVKYGDAPSYNGSTPTKPDDEGYYYTFKGWSPTVSDVTGNQTYVAEYTKNPYTYYISFNGNGATSGSMNNQSFKFGTAQALTANTYKREYTVTYNTDGGNAISAETVKSTFKGWEDHGTIVYQGTTYGYPSFDVPFYADSPGDIYNAFGYDKYRIMQHYVDHGKGEGRALKDESGKLWAYPDKATVNNMSSTNDATVDLYASWELGYINLPTPTKNGYTFVGWSDGSKTYAAGEKFTPTKNTTLTAQWAVKVTLNNHSATTAGTAAYWFIYNTTKVVNGETIYYWTDSACTAPLYGYTITTPTKNGYTFGGYYTEENGKGTQYVNDSGVCINNLYTARSTNITLHAYWIPVNYTATFVYGDGQANGTQKFTADVALALPVPTKTGHSYVWKVTAAAGNWVKDKTYTGSSVAKGMYGNVTFTLAWTANTDATYTVHYYYEGTQTSVAPSKTITNQTYGTEHTEEALSLTGYTLISAAQQKVTASYENNEIIFYYKPIKYTITWCNEDNSVIDTTTVEYGLVPTHAAPEKAATAEYTYTFAGWTPEVVAVTGDAS